MARRREIIDAFYNDLLTYATGTFTVTDDDGNTSTITLTSDDVDLIAPEYREKKPAVFYRPEATRHVAYNGVGRGPDYVERDDLGNVVYSEWQEYAEVFFLVAVRGSTPAEKEPIYESVRRGFEKYASGGWNPSTLHSHIKEITIDSSQPANDLDLEDAIWGDQLEIHVEFKRRFIVESGGSLTMDEAVEAVENIASVDLDVDVGNDDTVDYQYTIT